MIGFLLLSKLLLIVLGVVAYRRTGDKLYLWLGLLFLYPAIVDLLRGFESVLGRDSAPMWMLAQLWLTPYFLGGLTVLVSLPFEYLLLSNLLDKGK